MGRRCDRLHAHTILRGKDPDGVWKTTKAASYPTQLCEAWADVIQSNFEQHSRGMPSSTSTRTCCSIDAESVDVDVESMLLDPDAKSILTLSEDVVEKTAWKLVYASAWKSAEAIHMLEGRSSHKALQHAARTPALAHCRIRLLCDNLACVCAFNKGRCKNPPLLRLCRRNAALCLIADLWPRWRYIESAHNPSDKETRPDLVSDAGEPQGDGIQAHHGTFWELLGAPGPEHRTEGAADRHM